MFETRPITKEDELDIVEIFGATNSDLELIADIIFFEYQSGWEDFGSLLIFRAIDGTIQYIEYYEGLGNGEGQGKREFTIEEIGEDSISDLIQFYSDIES